MKEVFIKDCKEPWINLQILSDGTIRPCCWCAGNLGNINEFTLEQIWNGEKIKELRNYISNGKIHPICSEISPCPYIRNYKR